MLPHTASKAATRHAQLSGYQTTDVLAPTFLLDLYRLELEPTSRSRSSRYFSDSALGSACQAA